MIGVTIDVKGDRALQARLDALPDQIKARLLTTITSLTNELLAGVRAAEPIKTGALRAATRANVTSGDNYVRGTVRIGAVPGRGGKSSGLGHNVAAAALEYGVHSAFTVASHQMRLTHIFGRPADGRLVMVNAYTRRVNITARRFLRDPFNAIKPIAEARIRAALAEEKL